MCLVFRQEYIPNRVFSPGNSVFSVIVHYMSLYTQHCINVNSVLARINNASPIRWTVLEFRQSHTETPNMAQFTGRCDWSRRRRFPSSWATKSSSAVRQLKLSDFGNQVAQIRTLDIACWFSNRALSAARDTAYFRTTHYYEFRHTVVIAFAQMHNASLFSSLIRCTKLYRVGTSVVTHTNVELNLVS